jgi:hypothetical protein
MSNSANPGDEVLQKLLREVVGENNTLTGEALIAAIDKYYDELRHIYREGLVESETLDTILQQTDPGQEFQPDVEEVSSSEVMG